MLVAEKDRKYVSAFYIRGIIEIVNEWVEDGQFSLEQAKFMC